MLSYPESTLLFQQQDLFLLGSYYLVPYRALAILATFTHANRPYIYVLKGTL